MNKEEMKDKFKAGAEKAGETAKEFGKRAGESAKKVGKWLGEKIKKGMAWGEAEIKVASVRVEKGNAKKRRKSALESLGKTVFESFSDNTNITLSVYDESISSIMEEIRTCDKIIADCDEKLAAAHVKDEDKEN